MSVLLVHSDLRRMLEAARPDANRREQFLASIVEDIVETYPSSDIWMPAYNYGFFSTGVFDYRQSRSQMGVLSEYFRAHRAHWRTVTPILSFSGIGQPLDTDTSTGVLEPNGASGPLSQLVDSGGTVLMLGCNVQWASLFHHAEVAGGAYPLYRYDKGFAGSTVKWTGDTQDVQVRYAVTSLNRPVAYDFGRIHEHFLDEGIVRSSSRFQYSYEIDAQDFVNAWQVLSEADPFWPLTDKSRGWAQPLVEGLGRGFQAKDFEEIY